MNLNKDIPGKCNHGIEPMKGMYTPEEMSVQISSRIGALIEKELMLTPHKKHVSLKRPNSSAKGIVINPVLGARRYGPKSTNEKIKIAIRNQLKIELPQLIKSYLPPSEPIPQSLHAAYMHQISLAQEFLNENRSVDLSRVKCLLRKMFPRDYHDTIELLKEQQDATIIYNINGGNNIIAPKAKRAKQFGSSKTDKKKQ